MESMQLHELLLQVIRGTQQLREQGKQGADVAHRLDCDPSCLPLLCSPSLSLRLSLLLSRLLNTTTTTATTATSGFKVDRTVRPEHIQQNTHAPRLRPYIQTGREVNRPAR
eukprot:CAMPEP_0173194120 /NCGR_PEP_ID=MMETSP1141-20130122/14333_1 /TAXON_ID=483371 /ORGANISM="non described non described, Strain CCMP2298" /LENGTH=110 /DNA_ID=CAMNT_0014118523 /DNA_START=248 /DNA_END=580 /DNA_ORIENTATION=-